MTQQETPDWSLLETIDDPAALRALPSLSLPHLADQLRSFLIETVAKTGGHLSSNLGTVELAIALHYVFNTPQDCLVWDVGHQSYAHKILTGRRLQMSTLRKQGGISGFPRRIESIYDCFGTAHSSTSISAVLGMATACQLKGEDHRAVAVIGDGAMSAGMAFEALNNAGVSDADVLVVLNDNEMSISRPVGAIHHYLSRLMLSPWYQDMRQAGSQVLKRIPPMFHLVRKAGEQVKGMMTPGALFEALGFRYFGPVDGHDLGTLVPIFQKLKRLRGRHFLHVVTQKGHGYPYAEADPILYHGVSVFNPEKGIQAAPATDAPVVPTYTQVFGSWLCDMAEQDEGVVGITPAMCEGSGLTKFAERFPKRYFDVGIAEQHALTFAAGMACQGLLPIVAIYSTFLQRAYDQLIHDIALQSLPVVLAVDRAGLVGADGATHAGAFDVAFLRCVPNIILMAASSAQECRQMLYTACQLARRLQVACVVRYPRGKALMEAGESLSAQMQELPLATALRCREGQSGVVILSFGGLLQPAMQAAERLDATLINMRFIKPLDEAMLMQIAAQPGLRLVVSIEDSSMMGGAGSAVLEFFAQKMLCGISFLSLGLPDLFLDHGLREDLLAECGLSADKIVASIEERLEKLGKKDGKR